MLRRWAQAVVLTKQGRRFIALLPEGVKRVGSRTLWRPEKIRWSRLRRLQPVSNVYGFDRGLPIDRHYIAAFIEAHARDIRGAVLEVRDPELITSFGGDRVRSVDLLDIDPTNVDATIVADLSEGDCLPAGRFDCFILTQTLQFVRDPRVAVANAYDCLAPGGVLLVTAPCLSRLDPTAGRDHDRWRFTPAGMRELLSAIAQEAHISVTSYGNVLTAAAFLMGVAAQELKHHELAYNDADFPLLVCARVVKV